MATSPAYSFIKERIELEFQKLDKYKVRPWTVLLSGKGLQLADFFGNKITYSGVSFEGSPSEVFWKGFIQPFLQDITSRSFAETRSFCSAHGLELRHPMEETASLLKAGINNIYDKMSDIDQRLRGKGFPKSVPKYDAATERASSDAFVEERLAAELALGQKNIEEEGMKEEQQTTRTRVSKLELGDAWKAIEAEYGESKRSFGKKIRFIKDPFKREIIFRDIAQAFLLEHQGFNKPVVVLAGGVIEELLRFYLEEKKVKPASKTLDAYIRACVNNRLLKSAIHKLADSFRDFRNIVHLEREKSTKDSISKPTAKAAVSSIFTITNDFRT